MAQINVAILGAGRIAQSMAETLVKMAAVSGTKIGIVGNFRVIECVRRFGESGEACEVTMQRE